MREEYDRIQKRMKDQMKRTTPFERIRKFFSRGKSKRKYDNEIALKINFQCFIFFSISYDTFSDSDISGRHSASSDLNISQARPTSNISLQSSSSE